MYWRGIRIDLVNNLEIMCSMWFTTNRFTTHHCIEDFLVFLREHGLTLICRKSASAFGPVFTTTGALGNMNDYFSHKVTFPLYLDEQLPP
jgi:hypothetical protein